MDQFIHDTAERIGLSTAYIEDKVAEVLSLAESAGLDLSGKILAGFDLNGPLTRTDDASLTGYRGVGELLRFLADTGDIYPVIITGWDSVTVTACAQRMGLDTAGIICERGMLYRYDGHEHFLYPQRDEESYTFMACTWQLAAEAGLKVAFQGNRSSGSQAIMVEADERAGIGLHPAVAGRRATLAAIYETACRDSDLAFDGDRLLFRPDAANMAGLYRALAGPYALTSLRAAPAPGGRVAVTMGDRDRPDFTLDDLAAFCGRVAAASGRIAFVNPDYGVDFLTSEALSSRYSKESAALALGRRVFGECPFLTTSVGDKEQDIFSGPHTLCFAQAGSEVHDLLASRGTPYLTVQDGRDCALILYEAHRATQRGAGLG